MEKKWYYWIRLQDGTDIVDSAESGDGYDTKKEAEDAADKYADEWLESQDCPDDEKFTSGDLRSTVYESLA